MEPSNKRIEVSDSTMQMGKSVNNDEVVKSSSPPLSAEEGIQSHPSGQPLPGGSTQPAADKELSSKNNPSSGENLPITPPSLPAPTHSQWEQILQRFDAFKQTIKSTIQEEIRVNTSGLQNEVQSIKTRLTWVVAFCNEVYNIDQKVSRLGELKEDILGEVDKRISSKIDSKIDFLREKYFPRRCNLMLMGLDEPDNDDDEIESIASLLQIRLGIPKPTIIQSVRMGTVKGKSPRPIRITFANFPQKLAVWYKKSKLNKNQPQKLWLQGDLPKPLPAELNVLLKVLKKAKSLPNTQMPK